MDVLKKFAADIDNLRLTGLFGGDTNELADLADTMTDEATQHFLMALSLLEQASRSVKLTAIVNSRK